MALENFPFARWNISESIIYKSIVATEFPQQNLGIDDFLFTCIAVPTPQHGNEIPASLCRNFILKSLIGIEIPTKWHWNEIPMNHPWELYTIYNPAARGPQNGHQGLEMGVPLGYSALRTTFPK